MRSWQRSFLAGIVIAALGVSTWATCVEGAMSPETQQMACCKHGHQTCGPNGSPADCCKKDGSKQRDVVTIAKVDHVRIPTATAMDWATLPDAAVLDIDHRPLAHTPSPPTLSPGPPAYIIYSTLLI